jgi:hypothetical protein
MVSLITPVHSFEAASHFGLSAALKQGRQLRYTVILRCSRAANVAVFTFAPCMLLHSLHLKPTHEILVKYIHIYI